MFKRLRERIAEEGIKFPVGQDSEGKGAVANSNEDLITLSDSSAVVVPHSSSHQFSIGEDEDGSFSEQNTPQRKQNDVSTSEKIVSPRDQQPATISDVNFIQEYRPSKFSYVPQSDIESEKEEPPTLNLDGISKDQLLSVIQTLKARSYKYKNKYAEVVKNYKELRDEKVKIENLLIENQDKGLRRLAELREQCQLEQKAKAHLEANLRLLLEEKDSRISVLETQINLLKEGNKSNGIKIIEDLHASNSDISSGDAKSDDGTLLLDASTLQEKVERLQHQQNQDKKTITAQKDQISLLRKQNESLTQELEDKIRKLNDLEDEQVKLKSNHESILKSMQVRLEELEKQQEESVMSMAETKRNMHEELELKEKQLVKIEEESRQFQALAEKEKESVTELKRIHDEKVNELQHQLNSLEKALEEEKQNVMQEFKRGNTATINLMQQECAKKVSAIEEEWKLKYQELEKGLKDKAQDEEFTKTEEKLKQAEKQVEELNSMILQLEKDNASLKNSVEKLESENLEAHHEENLKGVKDKLQNAEKNYRTQMEEMKNRISQLEIEKSDIETEKQKLVKVEEEFTKWKNGENKVQEELKTKEKELKVMQKKLESANQEQVEKTRTFQESMKDKENTIVKLKTQLETVVKENAEKFEELNKKIKLLEHEREQIMLQAQERVSSTEAKCREDLKSLQDRNNKLLVEVKEVEKLRTELNLLNNQLDESLLVAEANQAAADKKISELREQLAKAEERCTELVKAKSCTENELSLQIQKLQEENTLLQCKTDSVERLKSEKEELNEKLKNAQQQIKIVNELQSEKIKLEQENKDIMIELESLRPLREEKDVLQKRIEALVGNKETLKSELTNIKTEKEKVISELQDSFNSERNSLKLANADLLKRISVLENFDNSDPQSTSLKEYIAVLRGECETAIKTKEAEMEMKLKQLVRDFCAQMDVKDKDCDQMITDMIEKSQDLEENLQKQHQIEISALRQDLFEKDCALDEMRDHYEEILLDKNKQIKEQESTIKNLSHKVANASSYDSSQHIASEGSDWDDTWAVPDETFAENSSPIHSSKACEEHLHQIESLQEEVSKCNSEIKELKILLRLSPPDSMVDNNNRRDSLQSIPEPTEFEYLKNIIYEYMMGKEPVTLAKVIAAVLRFSESQTEQVVRREETRHHTR
ncbi:golgin subfamily A member 4-like isoform X2 [Uloborus diversus]|uniref:golgin subfamily A member 4-like isoform X2 n=1 Tax=Uloborus diversus TaxID=327109 RepID=UPI00240A9262|nr:golgin subfamily A member 4-like isoform X2 [Uloborus diversus]